MSGFSLVDVAIKWRVNALLTKRKEEYMIGNSIEMHPSSGGLSKLIISTSNLFSFLNKLVFNNQNRKKNMHPKTLLTFEAGWVAPTNSEIAELKNGVGYSTIELANSVGMNPKHLRNYLKEANYIKGDRIQYVIWRYWLEGFGLVEPQNLQPERIVVRSKIFSHDEAEWEKPNLREFRVLAVRSGSADSTVSRLLGLAEPLVNHLLHGRDAVLSSPLHVEHKNWINFLNKAGLNTLRDFLSPPNLPDETLKPLADGFVPPEPRILRQFVGWTGLTPEELCAKFGLEPGRLTYYMSNRSARTHNATIDPAVFSVENWRAPTYAEIRTFLNVTPTNPMELAQRLKIGKAELATALRNRNNDPSMKVPLDISQSDWFKLLDSQKIITSKVMDKLTEREGTAHYIPYSAWRVMLQAYGIVEPVNLRK